VKKVLVIILLILSINLSFAQYIDSLQINEMEKVQWLVGKWKGEGWMMFGPEEKHTFSQTETVTSKLNGILLAIEGLGTDRESNIIHNAFAVLSFDSANQKFVMRAHKADGAFTEADAIVDDKGNFIWGFSHPYAGELRFTIKQNDKGQWYEIGEVSSDGGNSWFQNFELLLNKLEEKTD
tara:strand:- start:9 stop:548 length:540 start_codon:yes stop_codon:yes gene_type:complete